MKKTPLWIVSLFPLILFGCDAPEQDEAQLRILATTDLHMYLNDFDYYRDIDDPNVGLVRTTTLIKKARSEVTNSILVDAGDLIQGSPMGDEAVYGGERNLPHAAFNAMNSLGYDAAAAGNHEFNFGLEFFTNAIKDANFPYLSANVYWDDGDDDDSNDKTLLQPYAILDRTLKTKNGQSHDIKIGIIGLLPPQIMNWDGDKLRGRVKTRDIRQSAEKYIPELEAQGADIIIALAHTGLSGAPYRSGAEQSGVYLAQLPDIDAVVTGHSHALFPSPNYARLPNTDIKKGTIYGKPVVMAGYFGSHLGLIDLKLGYEGGAWKVLDGQSSLRAITEKTGNQVSHIHADADMEALIDPYHHRTRSYMAQPVGETTERLSTYVAHLRDEPALDLIAEAQRAYVKNALKETEFKGLPILSAVAPFKAGGRPGPDYYTDIPAGPLTLRHVADLYVYPNVITAVHMNGNEVREWLEMSTRIFNTIDPKVRAPQPLVNDFIPSYNFDVLDGLTFRIDLSQPPRYGRDGEWEHPEARRIIDLRFNGKLVSNQDEFIVATNNYRANGGGSFPGLDGSNVVLTSTDTVQQALSNYLRNAGTITPKSNNSWSFAPLEGAPQVIYKVGPKGEEQVAALEGARKLEEDEDGFSTFILDFNALAQGN
ncbi:MAG: bifunctional 2',3'-cyclic-nucleotide 2'-phosphodiesterase/3'-nucleotidase [Sphingomonadales bacterium]|jgi:2',3'-cyclic-nucleotide 2'-phosphodiesterase/3'-nucleotidase